MRIQGVKLFLKSACRAIKHNDKVFLVYICIRTLKKIAMKSIILAILVLASVSFSAPYQPISEKPFNEDIEWLSWEEVSQRASNEKRKIMVDLYTDWCGWCKKMDAATFEQDYISSFINKNYYAVKFNAEMKEDVVFKGKTYSFVARGQRGYHELASEITRGRLGYPTVVFLDEDMEVIQALPGFRGPEEFEKILTYFAGDYHKKMSWDKYEQSYGTTVPVIPRE